jgi:hypothetical protein
VDDDVIGHIVLDCPDRCVLIGCGWSEFLPDLGLNKTSEIYHPPSSIIADDANL